MNSLFIFVVLLLPLFSNSLVVIGVTGIAGVSITRINDHTLKLSSPIYSDYIGALAIVGDDQSNGCAYCYNDQNPNIVVKHMHVVNNNLLVCENNIVIEESCPRQINPSLSGNIFGSSSYDSAEDLREREIRTREREQRAKEREREREIRDREREQRTKEREIRAREREERAAQRKEEKNEDLLAGEEYVPCELADLHSNHGDNSLDQFRGVGRVIDTGFSYVSSESNGVKTFMMGPSAFLTGKYHNFDLVTRRISPPLNYAFKIIGEETFILDNLKFRGPLRILKSGQVADGTLLYDARDKK